MPNNPETEPFSRTQILILMAITALTLSIVAKLWQIIGKVDILAVKFTLEAVWQGFALAIAIILSSSLIYRFWAAYRRSADVYLNTILTPLLWLDLPWLGILPGLSEELLFRGVILPSLGFDLTALILSSLIFGVLHLSSLEQWPYVVWATLVGFVLGYVALITGNLLVPVIAHILTNFISSCFWKAKLFQYNS
jgi:membrane protease YdiL (CAAX protease family)